MPAQTVLDLLVGKKFCSASCGKPIFIMQRNIGLNEWTIEVIFDSKFWIVSIGNVNFSLRAFKIVIINPLAVSAATWLCIESNHAGLLHITLINFFFANILSNSNQLYANAITHHERP